VSLTYQTSLGPPSPGVIGENSKLQPHSNFCIVVPCYWHVIFKCPVWDRPTCFCCTLRDRHPSSTCRLKYPEVSSAHDSPRQRPHGLQRSSGQGGRSTSALEQVKDTPSEQRPWVCQVAYGFMELQMRSLQGRWYLLSRIFCTMSFIFMGSLTERANHPRGCHHRRESPSDILRACLSHCLLKGVLSRAKGEPQRLVMENTLDKKVKYKDLGPEWP
jgi:hypothetical protein